MIYYNYTGNIVIIRIKSKLYKKGIKLWEL